VCMMCVCVHVCSKPADANSIERSTPASFNHARIASSHSLTALSRPAVAPSDVDNSGSYLSRPAAVQAKTSSSAFSSPSSKQQSPSSSRDAIPLEPEVNQLVDMGYPLSQARQAWADSRHDINQAAIMLASGFKPDTAMLMNPESTSLHFDAVYDPDSKQLEGVPDQLPGSTSASTLADDHWLLDFEVAMNLLQEQQAAGERLPLEQRNQLSLHRTGRNHLVLEQVACSKCGVMFPLDECIVLSDCPHIVCQQCMALRLLDEVKGAYLSSCASLLVELNCRFSLYSAGHTACVACPCGDCMQQIPYDDVQAALKRNEFPSGLTVFLFYEEQLNTAVVTADGKTRACPNCNVYVGQILDGVLQQNLVSIERWWGRSLFLILSPIGTTLLTVRISYAPHARPPSAFYAVTLVRMEEVSVLLHRLCACR